MKTPSFAHSRGKSNKSGEEALTVDSPKQKLESLSPHSTSVTCDQRFVAGKTAHSCVGLQGCKTRRMNIYTSGPTPRILLKRPFPPRLQNSCLSFKKEFNYQPLYESLCTSSHPTLAFKGLRQLMVSSCCVLLDLQDIGYLLREYAETILFHSLISIGFYQVFIE